MKSTQFLSFLVVLLFGCSKESNPKSSFLESILSNERSALPTTAQMLDLLLSPTDGYFVLSSVSGVANQNTADAGISLAGIGYSKIGTQSDFGAFNYGGNAVTLNSRTQYFLEGQTGLLGLFGTNNSVTLAGKTTLPGFSTSVYVPKLMAIQNLANPYDASITSGSTISWNQDANNTLGVGILITFNPFGAENRGKNIGNAVRVDKFIHTQDNGNYSFQVSDLTGIPANARISLRIGRGNYNKISTTDGYCFGIVSCSEVMNIFTKI